MCFSSWCESRATRELTIGPPPFRYIADFVYGLGTLYFFIGVIAACMISYWASRLVTGAHSKQSSWQKLLGAFRYLAYRRYKVAGYLMPSLGVMLLLASGALFFLGMPLQAPESREAKDRRLTDET